MAHAIHSLLDANRHALAIAPPVLATGILVLDGCTFSLGNSSSARIFAGGVQIGGFTVDAGGVVRARHGKLLFAPSK